MAKVGHIEIDRANPQDHNADRPNTLEATFWEGGDFPITLKLGPRSIQLSLDELEKIYVSAHTALVGRAPDEIFRQTKGKTKK